MSINLVEINTEIKTILDSITGAGKPFALALSAPSKQPAQYPVVYPILERSFPMQKESNRINFVPVAFIVRGVMEVRQYSAESYLQMLDIIGETMTALQKRSIRTLNGKVHNVDQVELVNWDYFEDTTRPVLMFDISFIAKVITDTGA